MNKLYIQCLDNNGTKGSFIKNESTGEMVQQTPLNRWANVQRTRDNYSDPVQKTAQMYQYQLIDAELAQ